MYTYCFCCLALVTKIVFLTFSSSFCFLQREKDENVDHPAATSRTIVSLPLALSSMHGTLTAHRILITFQVDWFFFLQFLLINSLLPFSKALCSGYQILTYYYFLLFPLWSAFVLGVKIKMSEADISIYYSTPNVQMTPSCINDCRYLTAYHHVLDLIYFVFLAREREKFSVLSYPPSIDSE